MIQDTYIFCSNTHVLTYPFRLFGPNNDNEWIMEGRRIIPIFPRLKGRTAFTTFANSLSLTTAIANERQTHFQRKKDGLYSINKNINLLNNFLFIVC